MYAHARTSPCPVRARARAFKLFLLFLHRDTIVTYPALLSTPIRVYKVSARALDVSLDNALPRECILSHVYVYDAPAKRHEMQGGKRQRERKLNDWRCHS